ncbi:MAG TPA: DUF5658 family protein [Acidimicrobiales bacterium]|nr:DUF5658 family protein [Acidimicrobiales bacterium]
MASTTTALSPLARVHAAVTLDEDDLASLRRLAVVALVLLNVFDIFLTRRLLALGATEANPLMAPFVHGEWGVILKTALPVAFGIRHLTAPLRRPLVLGLCWVCVLYMGVVLWNAHLLGQAHLLGL